MNAEDLAGTFQGVDSRLSRIEGIVQEMSKGLTRLTRVVNVSGSVITILLAITPATI
jgi:hypothetical protein